MPMMNRVGDHSSLSRKGEKLVGARKVENGTDSMNSLLGHVMPAHDTMNRD